MSLSLPVIAALLALIPAASHASEARGKSTPPLEKDCVEVSGTALSAIAEGPAYAAAELKCGAKLSLVLRRQTGRNGALPVWTAVDQVTISKPSPRHELLQPAYCSSSRFPDVAVFALGRMVEQPDGSYRSEDVVKAWRFDIKRERLAAIPADGVICALDGGD
ncbi:MULTISPECIES: hypothetical protein [unclassified Rhizobium]|uniref:hypothetical protein n=1 Tax=unclassified Rhizobium TaxID=2613769 RepID=UPI0007E978C3|nr:MULTISPECIES: hypothetical protein [unclassified Rhizobium]ANK86254.1 hypothetical protein AMK02_CH02688 [Rhizobium sp. N731]ANL16500.1 hypothetical protein AMJ97_CH02686 [Rhizobium sp. N1314]